MTVLVVYYLNDEEMKKTMVGVGGAVCGLWCHSFDASPFAIAMYERPIHRNAGDAISTWFVFLDSPRLAVFYGKFMNSEWLN